MGIIKEILTKGILHENYPAPCPKIIINKEHQEFLNKGKYVVVKDTHYNELYYVFKEDFSKPLNRDNISLRLVNSNSFDSNPVRQKELENFYKKFPKYKP